MSDFWRGQKVLLTGANGFLGQHVARLLDAEHIYWSGPPRDSFDLTVLSDVYDYFVPNDMEMTGSAENRIVIHCAANVGGIGKNQDQPARIMYENLLMNTHVLHMSWVAGAKKFIGLGSVCAYPKFTPVPFRERHLWDGYPEETNAPYGITKRALLAMSQAYRQQYFFNAIHLLVVNLYGPGDNFDLQNSHVIPAIMRKMHEAKLNRAPAITLWGDGSATREFLYVEDAARAILSAAEHYNSAEPVNIGSGHEVSIRELAEMIAGIVGYSGHINWQPEKPNGQPRRRLDTTRAEATIGFTAQTALVDGLQNTYDWYVTEGVGV